MVSGAGGYPTGGEYREALHNTGLCFRDPVLRGGSPVLDPLGLPRAISGNFASVFTVRGSDERRWAVKCFTRAAADQALRYERISAALKAVGGSWKTDFEYLPEGVLCYGRWYPALKMEWVDATGLIPYVERNLDSPPALAALAGKFAALVADLARAGVAHGDLQHGNLLVTQSGELKLIDYDGMYVPELSSLGACEIGHANYQSPLRDMATWGPEIDRFSAWVIYVSLAALAIEPALWTWLHADGDEALLFRKADFAGSGGSRVLAALLDAGDPRLWSIAENIGFLWAGSLRAVPVLQPGALQHGEFRAGLAGEEPVLGAGWIASHRSRTGSGRGSRRTARARADEQAELDAVDRKAESELSRIDLQVASLRADEEGAARAALADLQKRHVAAALRGQWIGYAAVHGIGPKLVVRLADYGIMTAADFRGAHGARLIMADGRWVGMWGLTRKRATALGEWRRSLEERARITQPTQLPPSAVASIRSAYLLRRTALTNARTALVTAAEAERAEIQRRWAERAASPARK